MRWNLGKCFAVLALAVGLGGFGAAQLLAQQQDRDRDQDGIQNRDSQRGDQDRNRIGDQDGAKFKTVTKTSIAWETAIRIAAKSKIGIATVIRTAIEITIRAPTTAIVTIGATGDKTGTRIPRIASATRMA